MGVGGAGARTFLGVCAPDVEGLNGDGADLGITILCAPPRSALGLPSALRASPGAAVGDLGANPAADLPGPALV